MRENSATHLPELVIDCPVCGATGWVAATSERHPYLAGLTIACPTCDGRSWIAAVAS